MPQTIKPHRLRTNSPPPTSNHRSPYRAEKINPAVGMNLE
jgi:hypothetical protein